jgi:TRAP-type mannitol/chloroaromatic compound transport system permease large subunit
VFLVLGSLFFGVASPTEAGAVGSVGTILLGLIYRTITWRSFKENCYLTLRITAMIIFIAIAEYLHGAFPGRCGEVITDLLHGLDGPWGVHRMLIII